MITKVQHLGILTLIILVRTHRFVDEIWAMINNDLSKSIRSITRDVRESEFLIRQVVNKDIQYFSYKMRKGQFLFQSRKKKKARWHCKAFKQLKHSLQWSIVFSQMKKMLARISWWTHRTTVGLLCHYIMYWYRWKPNTQFAQSAGAIEYTDCISAEG